MAEHSTMLREQFDDLHQQEEASAMGMWVFLATEILLFGAVFNSFFVYRHTYYAAFADGSRELDTALGVTNTAVLLCSSLMAALAVSAVRRGDGKGTGIFLMLTIALGIVFLSVKAVEYTMEYRAGRIPWLHWQSRPGDGPGLQLFFIFYFLMTLLHALHMVIGMSVLAVIARMAQRGRFSASYYNPVEISTLYWHFVDIVWIFLLPTLYLIQPTP